MARRRRVEEKENHEAWAIPFADLLTLLLAFFVVMYAISSVNTGKYRVVSDSLNSAFRGAAAVAAESSEIAVAPAEEEPAVRVPAIAAPAVQTAAAAADSEAQRAEMARIAADIEQTMRSLIDGGQVEVRAMRDRVEIEMRSDILFSSGSATLARDAESAISQLAAVLRMQSNFVRVEGHTDDRPIRTAQFASNWELSAARAATVVRLFSAQGVEPSRMAVLGLGEFRPLDSNRDPVGRARNRRVLVVVLGTESIPLVPEDS